jgi:hypothetical protein
MEGAVTARPALHTRRDIARHPNPPPDGAGRERTKRANGEAIVDAARAVLSGIGYGAASVRAVGMRRMAAKLQDS